MFSKDKLLAGSDLKTTGAFHSTKNFGLNFRKFPWTNGIDFSDVENDLWKMISRAVLFAWKFSMTSRSKRQNTDTSTL